MHHDKASRAENTLKAVAVMTAYYGEEGSGFASQIASEYLKEPHGISRLFDGFVHLTGRLLATLETPEQDKPELLRLLAEQITEEGRE